jgi:hypothetical protein
MIEIKLSQGAKPGHGGILPAEKNSEEIAAIRGLVVADKSKRVAHYHAKTIHATAELISSAGLRHTSFLNRTHIHRCISQLEIKRYDQLFPYLKSDSLLSDQAPEPFSLYLRESSSERFIPESCST